MIAQILDLENMSARLFFSSLGPEPFYTCLFHYVTQASIEAQYYKTVLIPPSVDHVWFLSRVRYENQNKMHETISALEESQAFLFCRLL